MKILIVVSFVMILASSTFACLYCESKCLYEQVRADQQFRWSYEYREVIYAGYVEEHSLRQKLRNRRRQEILDYGYGYSLNRPHYNHRYGSYKGGSYMH